MFSVLPELIKDFQTQFQLFQPHSLSLFDYSCFHNSFYMLETKIDKFANNILVSANNVDPDEVAHDEPPHLDLHCLPSSL